MADVVDPTTAAGGGVAGSILTLAGIWLKQRLGGGGKDRDHEEIDALRERLIRIEADLQAVRSNQERYEASQGEIRAALQTMNEATTKAQIELANKLGRIEGILTERVRGD